MRTLRQLCDNFASLRFSITMHQSHEYPSKILLSGEYTVLLGYPAIAIPWLGRYAQWKDKGSEIDQTLLNFYHFINDHPRLKDNVLLDELNQYIKSGGHLESSIPFGYGLGSSGSFCAAVLDRFGIADVAVVEADSVKKQREIVFNLLKEMENFFHGQSSGLDPMVSYYRCAVQICKGEITFPDINVQDIFVKYGLFLVDSNQKRDTQQLVSDFKNSIQNDDYRSKLVNELVPFNQALISSLIENDDDSFCESWKKLSEVSLNVFPGMIPERMNRFWNHGITSESYYCKLCGAGGGGLFLVMVKDEKVFEQQLALHGLDLFS